MFQMEPEIRHFIVRKVSTNEQAANECVAFMCLDDYWCFYQNHSANVRIECNGGVIENWRLSIDNSLPKGTIVIDGSERSRLGLVIGDLMNLMQVSK